MLSDCVTESKRGVDVQEIFQRFVSFSEHYTQNLDQWILEIDV